jgi:6-phosphogluconate dehydrogenase
MAEKRYEIGMAGLGVIRRNLASNIANHGYSMNGYDNDLRPSTPL